MAKQVVVTFKKYWGIYHPGESAAFSEAIAKTLIDRETAEFVSASEDDAPDAMSAMASRMTGASDKGAKSDAKGGK